MLSCWRHLRDSPSCVFLCLTLRPTAEKAGMFLRKPAMREIKWGRQVVMVRPTEYMCGVRAASKGSPHAIRLHVYQSSQRTSMKGVLLPWQACRHKHLPSKSGISGPLGCRAGRGRAGSLPRAWPSLLVRHLHHSAPGWASHTCTLTPQPEPPRPVQRAPWSWEYVCLREQVDPGMSHRDPGGSGHLNRILGSQGPAGRVVPEAPS